MGKLLILFGILLIGIGILLTVKIPIPFLGKLPGDLIISGENYHLYIPITTCLLISLILTFFFYIFSK